MHKELVQVKQLLIPAQVWNGTALYNTLMQPPTLYGMYMYVSIIWIQGVGVEVGRHYMIGYRPSTNTSRQMTNWLIDCKTFSSFKRDIDC